MDVDLSGQVNRSLPSLARSILGSGTGKTATGGANSALPARVATLVGPSLALLLTFALFEPATGQERRPHPDAGMSPDFHAPSGPRQPVVQRIQEDGAGMSAARRPPSTEEDEDPAPLVPLKDFWGATKDFGRETWLVASSPARLDRRGALQLAGVLGVGGLLFALDEDIQESLSVDGERGGLHRLLYEVGNFLEPVGYQGNTNLYWAAAALTGYLTRQEWLHAPAKQILYAHWIGSLGRQAAGMALGRRRPNEGVGAYEFDPGGGTSFPSGHAAVMFELAYVLDHHISWRPLTPALYGLAGAVAFQRADDEAHWASDVWLGSAWGLLVARIVVAAEETDRISVEPIVDPRTATAGVGLTFRF